MHDDVTISTFRHYVWCGVRTYVRMYATVGNRE